MTIGVEATAASGMQPRRFAIVGVGGYIAPRHLRAIRETGNEIIAALDPSDSVGILDSYSYDTAYFREFERFDRHLEKLRRRGAGAEYVSICSPNYLHDAHMRFALRIGAHAICEKPLVINPWNLKPLLELADEHQKRIYAVLQLRYHPTIQALRKRVAAESSTHQHTIDLTYITPRGRWYLNSWKGNVEQSGGLATNIGIHFFDMLIWIFGTVQTSRVHLNTPTRVAGFLQLERACVRWFLSINQDDLPAHARSKGKTTYRNISVDGEDLEFSEGFTDLHTELYRQVLAGNGFGPEDARASIELAHAIRVAQPVAPGTEGHPFLSGRNNG